MTDAWSRPDADAPPEGSIAIEVPLTGAADATGPAGGDDRPPIGRRQGVVAAALGAAAILGIVVAIQVVGGDDDAAAPGPTGVDELASRLTTPPTLGPADTLPGPDDPASTEESLDDGPQPTTSQDWMLFDTPPVPTYPELPDASLRDIIEYDINGAVDRLADDLPRRSDTHYELGSAGYVLDVTIRRDPVHDRYHIVTTARGNEQVAIVDVATGTTYVNPGTDNRVEIPNAEIVANSTATTINEYFDRLLKGPVRPDSFSAPSTRGRSLVAIPDLGAAREFITDISGDRIPEWQTYAFGPVFEFPVEDRPTRLSYRVYVDEAGDIVQVDGVSMLGEVRQLVQHRMTVLDEPEPIDLEGVAETVSTPPVPTTTP